MPRSLHRGRALKLLVGALALIALGVAIVALPSRHSPKRAPSAERRRPAEGKPSTTTAAGVTPLADAGASASFRTLNERLGGEIGLAAAPLDAGEVRTFGGFQQDHAWSTMKVPVLVRLLADLSASKRQLSPTERDQAARALEQSDNTAAQALFTELEHIHGGLINASVAVKQTLAAAGDTSTMINTAPNSQGFTTWGQSIWSNTGEVLFYRALAAGCLLSTASTNLVLGLMRNVTASQRWGVGQAGYPAGTPVAFKAGWGPQPGGYLVRQTAIVGTGTHGYVVSAIAKPSSGSFGDGVRMIGALMGWARDHLSLGGGEAPPRCRRA